MNKKYILFDLDGTISDSKIGIAKSLQYSLKSFDIDVKDLDELIPLIGPPLKESFKKFYGFNDTDTDKAIAKYREYFSKTGIFENTLYDGIDILLKTLKESGKTLILCTSKPAIYASQILNHFNIDKYFTFISGSELDGRRSKKSEVISYALENCEISSMDQVIMVGDREYDIFGAKEIGIDSIAVSYGYGSVQELSNAGATFIVKSVNELLDLLNTK